MGMSPGLFGGLTALTGLLGGVANQQKQQQDRDMVRALLMQKGQQGQAGLAPPPTGGQYGGMYEGNIPTAANPYAGGQFGMQPQASATSASPIPPTGAPPLQPSVFDQGAAAVPFSNGGSVDPITAMMMPPPG